FDEPPGHVDVVIFDGQVEQRAAGNRCYVQAVTRFDPQLGGENFTLLEAAFQQRRIAVQVGGKQVNPATTQRHDRRVRQVEAGSGEHFQACVSALGVSHIGADQHGERIAVLSGDHVRVCAVVK